MQGLTPHDADELRRIRRKLDSISGPGVINTPDAVMIQPQAARPVRVEAQEPRLVKLTGQAGTGMYGCYTALLIDRPGDLDDGTGALAAEDLGENQSEVVYCWNLAEAVTATEFLLDPAAVNADASPYYQAWEWTLTEGDVRVFLFRTSSSSTSSGNATGQFNDIWYRYCDKGAGTTTYHLLDANRDYRHSDLLLWLRIAGLAGAAAATCKLAVQHGYAEDVSDSIQGVAADDILVGFNYLKQYTAGLDTYNCLIEATSPDGVTASICTYYNTGALYLRVETTTAAANHYIAAHVASMGEILDDATWTTI